tara:strand:+ start:428 stop:847 length:420 start_codon:yes stop_codon:yes gene_type:complete
MASFMGIIFNKARHGDGFFVTAAPSLQSRACLRRYVFEGYMRKFGLLVLLLFTVGKVSAMEYVLPKYTPAQAESLIFEYLHTERPKTDLSQYDYESLSYTYTEGFWTASFVCKKVELSCHFGVSMTNDENPKFTFMGGL